MIVILMVSYSKLESKLTITLDDVQNKCCLVAELNLKGGGVLTNILYRTGVISHRVYINQLQCVCSLTKMHTGTYCGTQCGFH